MLAKFARWYDQKCPRPIKILIRHKIIVSLIVALLAFATTLVTVTDDSRVALIKSVSETYAVSVAAPQEKLIKVTTDVVREAASRDATPLGTDKLSLIEDEATSVLSGLSGFNAPTSKIEKKRDNYRRAIESVLGAINRVDGSEDSNRRFLNALQTAANAGGDFRQAVESFTASTWNSFWGNLV